jgi:hypothetical protein
MFTETFFHNTIRKYVALFGTLFNGIYINRVDSNDETIQSLKVPLTYGPKEKMLARLYGDPELNRAPAIVLPIISFEMGALTYDGSRKATTRGKFYSVADSAKSRKLYQYNPVPYNIDFTVSILAKNQADATRIVEQILPYFTPEFTLSATLIPELGVVQDVPVVLTGVSQEDVYEGDFDGRRTITWTLQFTLKGYLYGPTKRIEAIKTAIVNLFPVSGDIDDAIGNGVEYETITTTPGLTANGEPTSNSSASIGVANIDADDNYGYIIEFDEEFDA